MYEKLPVPEKNTLKIWLRLSLNGGDRSNLKVWCSQEGLIKIRVSGFTTSNYGMGFDRDNFG